MEWYLSKLADPKYFYLIRIIDCSEFLCFESNLTVRLIIWNCYLPITKPEVWRLNKKRLYW
jgi:hypothetical protein